MSTISGLSSSSVNGLQGYGGLASGLDRDSLIEGMTYATQSKIYAQQQKKEAAEWEQELIQSFTSSMYDFSNKYMSFASSSNLLGGSLFSQNLITANGDNNKYLSVSGNGAGASALSIAAVKQMAQNAQLTTKNPVSSQTLKTEAFSGNMTDVVDVSVVEGQTMYIEFAGTRYSVSMQEGEGYNYADLGETVAAMNKSLGEVDTSYGKTLGEVMKFEVVDGKIVAKDIGSEGRSLKLDGGTGTLMSDLGFTSLGESFDKLSDERIDITAEGLVAQKEAAVTKESTIADILTNQSITFTYNGKSAKITLGDYTDGTDDTMDQVMADMQKELDKAFGKGRISVEGSAADGIGFRTTIPNSGSGGVLDTDNSSILTINSAGRGVLGDTGIFGIDRGTSNRVKASASVKDSGIASAELIDTTGAMTIKNGSGELIDLTSEEYGLSWDSSVDEIIKTINGIEDLGIEISYQQISDKFVITSTHDGASGDIDLSGTVADLFTKSVAADGTAVDNFNKVEGQDAILSIKYDGSDEIIDIVRDSNTINIDGLSITVKGEFGTDDTGAIVAGEEVTFDAKVDVDKTYDIIKEMVDEYNEILVKVNEELRQKPSGYDPLTQPQRDEMSESQIELWEEKAKEGLLFGDSDLRGLSDDLRFSISPYLNAELSKIGISTSTNYADNGKLVIDETKLRAALAEDPENVQKLFNGEAGVGEEGETTYNGLMVEMKETFDKYAGTTGATKGILVERAGTIHAPTSVLDNYIQDQIDEYDEFIATLQDRLEAETDRYIAQFTQLETVISQLNSQSSYLTSMFQY